jgi:Uma2 family endonuclease
MTQALTETSQPKYLTRKEFYAYDDGSDMPYELVDGELVALLPISFEESIIIKRLFFVLSKLFPIKLLALRDTMLEVLGRRAKVRMPNLMILGQDCSDALHSGSIAVITFDMPPPLVAIEVVSAGRENNIRDYRYKRSEYAARGILEYWIVDPEIEKVTVLTLVDGLYEEQVYGIEDQIISTVVTELAIAVKDIF